jgi:hypothetical protein
MRTEPLTQERRARSVKKKIKDYIFNYMHIISRLVQVLIACALCVQAWEKEITIMNSEVFEFLKLEMIPENDRRPIEVYFLLLFIFIFK